MAIKTRHFDDVRGMMAAFDWAEGVTSISVIMDEDPKDIAYCKRY